MDIELYMWQARKQGKLRKVLLVQFVPEKNQVLYFSQTIAWADWVTPRLNFKK